MDKPNKVPKDPIKNTSSWIRWPVILLMTMVLVVAGLLSAMMAMTFAIRGREVVVPELSGMTESEAAAIMFDVGLRMVVESHRFSGVVPSGAILEQTPRAGSSVKRDRSIRVLLSLGDRQFPVPDVEGNSLRSAQMVLDQRGLTVGNTLYAHSDIGQKSTVIYQFPSAGDMGGSDPSVNVLVSLGPVTGYFIMPNVTGQQANDAASRIRDAGFRIGRMTYTRQPNMGQGRILNQHPPAGYKVSKTDLIQLEVSE